MRIWHEKLIPKLCRQHLLAVWREGLGCYSILVNDKKGYRNHPAAKEWEGAKCALWLRLGFIRDEMVKRGYKPKPMPPDLSPHNSNKPKEWQTLEQQIEVLKSKGCNCKV